jgi:ectoine hydroxylase-related dioxygenase (phytanoyl-CoA dioxygenase family)
VCCRVTYCGQRSATLLALADDARLTRAAAWADASLRAATDRLDGISVVLKHPEVVSGLSDLPWHRDCGLGGHPVLCPALNIGIQLDRADAANGQLAFLAGSHHHTSSLTDADHHADWPVVRVEAAPGDVTVHYGHVQHAAPPPTSPTANRRALYVGFVPPAIFDVVGPEQGYNDVVYQSADGVQPPSAL